MSRRREQGSSRPRLLDLFCCQGGAAMGYYQAGFDVVGVDILPQPRYPFEFHQANALEYVAEHGAEFDVIHASPPCLKYQKLNTSKQATHPDLIAPTREALKKTRKPYVIENVPNAKKLLYGPIMLCGTMFGLNLHRHRFFEVWPAKLHLLPPHQHTGHPVLISGVSRIKGQPRKENSAAECAEAAEINWMTRAGLDQAIPPAFARFIGNIVLKF